MRLCFALIEIGYLWFKYHRVRFMARRVTTFEPGMKLNGHNGQSGRRTEQTGNDNAITDTSHDPKMLLHMNILIK